MEQLHALTPAQISHKRSRNVHPGWAQTAQHMDASMDVERSSPKAIRDANAITLSNSIRRVSTPKTAAQHGTA